MADGSQNDNAMSLPGHPRANLGRSTSSLPAHYSAQDEEYREDELATFGSTQSELGHRPARRGQRPVLQPAALQSYAVLHDATESAPRLQAETKADALNVQRPDNLGNDRLVPSGLLGDEQYVDVDREQELQNFPGRRSADEEQTGEDHATQHVVTTALPPVDLEDSPDVDKTEHFARQIRQARKLTDEVLIKRTLWLQELDRLAHSRAFLRNSTAELMSLLHRTFEIQSTHPKERQRTKQRAERTEEILKEAPRRPADVDSPLNTSISAPSTGDKAHTSSDSGIGSSKPEFSQLPDAAKIYEQYGKDCDAVIAQEEIIKGLAYDLSNLEYRLEQKQRAMSGRLGSRSLAADLRSEMLDPALDVSVSSQPERTGVSTPPLVRKYFDRQGDVGIWRERLIELDYTHEEGKMEREFLRDRGDPVDPPDMEFELNYQSRRDHILHELDSAEKEADQLKKECLNVGLNTEFHRESAHYTYSEGSPLDPEGSAGIPHSPSPVQILHMPAPKPAFGLSEGPAQRVGEWLRDLATTPAAVNEEQIEP